MNVGVYQAPPSDDVLLECTAVACAGCTVTRTQPTSGDGLESNHVLQPLARSASDERAIHGGLRSSPCIIRTGCRNRPASSSSAARKGSNTARFTGSGGRSSKSGLAWNASTTPAAFDEAASANVSHGASRSDASTPHRRTRHAETASSRSCCRSRGPWRRRSPVQPSGRSLRTRKRSVSSTALTSISGRPPRLRAGLAKKICGCARGGSAARTVPSQAPSNRTTRCRRVYR